MIANIVSVVLITAHVDVDVFSMTKLVAGATLFVPGVTVGVVIIFVVIVHVIDIVVLVNIIVELPLM